MSSIAFRYSKQVFLQGPRSRTRTLKSQEYQNLITNTLIRTKPTIATDTAHIRIDLGDQ